MPLHSILRLTVCLATLAGAGLLCAEPGIEVTGNEIVIADGDTSPSLADGTDFGNVAVGSEAQYRIYTIKNTGGSNLFIYSVQTIGGNSGQFTVPVPPAQVIGPGATSQFLAWFGPAGPAVHNTTLRINNNASDDLRYEYKIRGTGTVPAPEINVQGNDMDILNGDPFPSLDDHTDFGPVDVDGDNLTRTFTIQNLGAASLEIASVQRIGGDTGDFSFRSDPSSTVPAGFQTTFKVRFNPTMTGLRRTTIRINSNDANESIYDFVIQGTGSSQDPDIQLVGNGMTIEAGDDEPSNDDHTSFGSAAIENGTTTRTFKIENAGLSELVVSSIEVTGGDASDFSIPAPPVGPIAPGGFRNLEIVFDPSAGGLRSTTLRIESNDADEDPYEVAIQGFGGSFKLVRIEQDGDDALIHFTANPDTSYTTFIYSLQANTGLDESGWTGTPAGFLSISGGGPQFFRHVDGFVGPARHWRIFESGIR